MNELGFFDPLARDSIDDTLRTLMHPWRFWLADDAPSIRIDLSEQDGSYLVKAELPGVRKEDIDVRIDGAQVTISTDAKTEKHKKDNGRVICKERQEGHASRSFTLACAVDEALADASYKDGVLALKLPKRTAASTRHLAIQ